MIFNFIGDYHRLLSDKDKKYLYRSLDIADPFAYFCITWQRYTSETMLESTTHHFSQWQPSSHMVSHEGLINNSSPSSKKYPHASPVHLN
jgi:hypothetical protein